MPFPYLFEMLADWSAMSIKFGDMPREFAEKNQDAMLEMMRLFTQQHR